MGRSHWGTSVAANPRGWAKGCTPWPCLELMGASWLGQQDKKPQVTATSAHPTQPVGAVPRPRPLPPAAASLLVQGAAPTGPHLGSRAPQMPRTAALGPAVPSHPRSECMPGCFSYGCAGSRCTAEPAVLLVCQLWQWGWWQQQQPGGAWPPLPAAGTWSWQNFGGGSGGSGCQAAWQARRRVGRVRPRERQGSSVRRWCG